MKILFFGAGVINTLYANALSDAGHSVSMVVREEKLDKWKNGIQLDVISERFGKKKYIKGIFTPRVVSTFQPEDQYDLIILSVKHYQTEEILPKIVANRGKALVLFFNNNWQGLGFIDKKLEKNSYLLGMPRAGGAIFNNTLDGAIKDSVILGDSLCGKPASAETTEACKNNLYMVIQLFKDAGIRAIIQPDMEHWYWVHFATTVAWIAGGSKAMGFKKFTNDRKLIREALEAGKEALAITKARGADFTGVEDAQPFLAPAWLSAYLTQAFVRGEVAMKISEGHGEYAPQELQHIYQDVVNTGKELGLATPVLDSFKPYMDRLDQLIELKRNNAA